MKYIFYIIAALSLVFSFLVIAGAKSAIHEIEAGVSFVVFVISLGFGGILNRLKQDEPDQDEKKCPFCLEYVKKGAVTCKHCGKDLPAGKDLSSWKVQTPLPGNETTKIKLCPRCGAQHKMDATVCGGCGWKPNLPWVLESDPSVPGKTHLKCPKCGAFTFNDPDARKCWNCGYLPAKQSDGVSDFEFSGDEQTK